MARINFNKFLLSIPDFNQIKKYAEPLTLNFDIINLPYWIVKKEIPELIKAGDYNSALIKAYSKKINNFDNYKKVRLFIHLLKEYESINKMEERNLKSELSENMKLAGFQRLNSLGVEGTILNLVNNDLTKFDEVKNKPYHLVFKLQLKNAILQDSRNRLKAIERNDRLRQKNSK